MLRSERFTIHPYCNSGEDQSGLEGNTSEKRETQNTVLKMKISKISIEVTRRCNLKCAFCCRGDAQDMNMKEEYIDSILNQVEEIDHLTFTGGEPSLNVPIMNYFIEQCLKKNVTVNYFCIHTNGISITDDFISTCLNLHSLCGNKGLVILSADKYHTKQIVADTKLLDTLPFFYTQRKTRWVLAEGRGQNLFKERGFISAGTNPFVWLRSFRDNYLTLNCRGEIINGIDFSYENQSKHYLCHVDDLTAFYDHISLCEMEGRYDYRTERAIVEGFKKKISKQVKIFA